MRNGLKWIEYRGLIAFVCPFRFRVYPFEVTRTDLGTYVREGHTKEVERESERDLRNIVNKLMGSETSIYIECIRKPYRNMKDNQIPAVQ